MVLGVANFYLLPDIFRHSRGLLKKYVFIFVLLGFSIFILIPLAMLEEEEERGLTCESERLLDVSRPVDSLLHFLSQRRYLTCKSV